MSTSRDSLIGLPLSRLSSTANSRARSWMARAIRYRYLARSRPGSRPQLVSNAFRADATARSTSASPAWATRARGSSDAGLSVVNNSPAAGGTNSPSTNRLYSRWIVTISRDSGAGAYSQPVPGFVVLTLPTMRWPPLVSVEGEIVRAGVGAGELLAALHEQIVEQAGGADAEKLRRQPLRPGDLTDQDQIADGVLGGPDAAGRSPRRSPARRTASPAPPAAWRRASPCRSRS